MADSAARLLHAVRGLNESLDPSRVLVRVCEEAAGLIAADHASVVLGDRAGGYRVEAAYGEPGERIGEAVVPGEGVAGEAIASGEPVVHGGAVAVPLRWGGRLQGALSVGFRDAREPSEADVELLEAFAELAAAACRNAGTHLELALVARTDALTGCLNHAAMHEALVREFERSRRHGQALSLVIVDMDEFKQVNERHGHLAGDEVLRRVGESLRDSVRAYDVVARYGGDEFAIIAIDADEATAAEVAARAVQAIRGALASLGGAGEATVATAGVAEWRPGDAPEDLIGRADAALLHGKHGGDRGGVVRAAAIASGSG